MSNDKQTVLESNFDPKAFKPPEHLAFGEVIYDALKPGMVTVIAFREGDKREEILIARLAREKYWLHEKPESPFLLGGAEVKIDYEIWLECAMAAVYCVPLEFEWSANGKEPFMKAKAKEWDIYDFVGFAINFKNTWEQIANFQTQVLDGTIRALRASKGPKES